MSAALKQQILQLIQAGVLTPEEGFGKLAALRREGETRYLPETANEALPAEEDALLYAKPIWQEAALTDRSRPWPDGRYLLFAGHAQHVTQPIFDSLRAAGIEPMVVRAGQPFRIGEPGEIWIDPGSEADYVRLADHIGAMLSEDPDRLPLRVLHYASLAVDASAPSAGWDERLMSGIDSLFFLTKALMAGKSSGEVKLTYLYSTASEGIAAHHEAIGSFARVVRNERPSFACRAVGIDLQHGAASPLEAVEPLRLEASDEAFEPDVRWRQGRRWTRRLAEAQPTEIGEDKPCWKAGGVYLLTGGMGGLGQAFADMLAGQYRAKLVLCGRREPDADMLAAIRRWEGMGAEAVYIRCDLSARDAVAGLVDEARRRFGRIDGVLHGAGVVKDRYLQDKSKADFDSVLSAKIRGTALLDEALQDEPLDLFCLFSSISAELGSPGQSDYAYGNGFMDYYAEHRERLRQQGLRSGRTLSVNWPLWRDGGMKVDEEAGKMVSRRLGIGLLELQDGFRALLRGLNGTEPRLMVLSGDRVKLRGAIGLTGSSYNDAGTAALDRREPALRSASLPVSRKPVSDADMLDELRRNLAASVAEFMKVPAHDIGWDNDWSDYGFDSISFMNFSNYLNDRFDFTLMPSVFFEYSTVAELAGHLAQTYGDKLKAAAVEEAAAAEEREAYRLPSLAASAAAVEHGRFASAEEASPSPEARSLIGAHAEARQEPPHMDASEEAVAIIGISGVMPQCDNLDIFWNKIAAGENLVTEIPSDRWDWRDYYGDPMTEPNKTNVIWGGFMNDVDKFDPLFFNLSPKEAGLMDPQQRIVIEQVWKTIEDAGYKASALSGSNTGVYIGVGSMDYGEVLTASGVEPSGLSATGLAHCMIANRVSYLLNLHGPSEPVDTACSSALVAIHKAVEAIRAGQCDLAIAGGVSVILRPTYYIGLSKAAMLSPDGKSRAFDKGANGYVRGEGCGMLLLKPLRKALADGDNIYALVKGSGTNHGGHANTLTTPNPNAQADLLADCWRSSGIDPSTVGYIEAHGTGTSLGDPIEINGLKKAFGRLYEERRLPPPATPHCAVGSVKTNVGHLEAAAGMAGVLKVILAMKHGIVPASLHLEELNPYIQLDGSPFYPVRKTEQWRRMTDAAGRSLPRRAGVSAFGFGGVNGHVILEEFMDERRGASAAPKDKELIVLSAKNRERLAEYAGKLGDYAAQLLQGQTGITLRQIACTLQTGREEMEERLAFAAGSLQEMASALGQFARGEQPAGRLYTGRVKSQAGASAAAAVGDDLEETARKWTAGGTIDWRSQSEDGSIPVKVPLPTYPFARKRCWIPTPAQKAAEGYSGMARKAAPEARYPAVHTFTVKLNATDELVDHHRVDGRAVLPGAAQAELAVYAANQIAGGGWRLSRIVWQEPVVVEHETHEVVVTAQYGNGTLRVELSGTRGESPAVYARAEFEKLGAAADDTKAARNAIADVQARCSYLGGQDWCYVPERSGDVAYGPYFQGLERMWGNDTEALALFRLPELAARDSAKYEMHPVMLDCALQTLKGIQPAERRGGAGQVLIPYALEGLEWLRPLPEQAYIHARVAGKNRFAIELMDESGLVCARLREVALREIKTVNRTPDSDEWLYHPEWKPAASPTPADRSFDGGSRQRILIVGTAGEGLPEHLQGLGELFVIQYGSSTRRIGGRLWEADRNDPNAYASCLNEIGSVDHVYFLGGLSPSGGAAAECTLDALKESRDRGLIQLFRLVKPLLALGKDDAPLPLTVVTNGVFKVRGEDRVDPSASELVGFSLTLGLEQANLELCVLDIDASKQSGDGPYGTVADALRLRLNQPGRVRMMAVREGIVYTRSMAAAKLPPADSRATPFRRQGVYLIVGGAGGIGRELALYLARNAKARVVLIGRSPLDEEKRRTLRTIEEAGGQALYVEADASNPTDMKFAVEEAKRRFGPIRGAVHSAVVLRDLTVKRMTEADLQAVLTPKSEGSVVLADALAEEPLDFLLFFSSAVSLSGSPGQANYAAGCSFKDAYAAALAERRPYPVRSINWGYWGTVGVASDELHYKRLLAQGIHSIAPEEGMKAIERILAGNINQIMPFKAEPSFLKQVGITKDESRDEEKTHASVREQAPLATVRSGRMHSQAAEYLRGVFAEALAMDRDEIDDGETFEAYGVDSVVVLDINRLLERDFGKLPSTLLFEYMTIEKLTGYLSTNHADRLARMFPAPDGQPVSEIASATPQDGDSGSARYDGSQERVASGSDAALAEWTIAYIRGVFAEALAMDPDEIDKDETFEAYGVDSVVVLDINRLLEQDFGKLPSTLLFEYMTVEKLAGYLTAHHKEKLERMPVIRKGQGQGDRPSSKSDGNAGEAEGRSAAPVDAAAAAAEPSTGGDMDIAIVGVSGLYPKADNLDQYWDNLRQGRDCISEIPPDRWQWRDYFDTTEGAPGKTYSKWGGFISNVDKFDPLFFSISPAEAEGMDPQERLFLQTAWAVLEDAGITRRELEAWNRQVGVFVGAMNADYEWLGAQATTKGVLTNAHSNFWSIANRVSYALDLHGPSMAVDTACSSSLTALHLACESIKRKECKAAIAGGVHLILHPAHYTRYSAVGMLSYGDRVKAFGDGADGFVDGEGVGAVLLKPLDQAVKDGDRIYGVIKSTSINSGGKTSGFTVPNLNAQADLVLDALRKSGVDPRTVSYVEAHGTGTSLGDPIEIAGLTKAFRTYTPDSHYCAIGTVKSNIGHLESAAGIAALTKVLLQLRHETIVPSLHSLPPNPKIDFENSPFYVARQPMAWSRPMLEKDGRQVEYPRRAGISSFGAGGANAHVIVEEYRSPAAPWTEEKQEGPAIVVLSAKNRDRLREYAARLASFLHQALTEDAGQPVIRLQQLCYTLQTGREPMEERLAFAASGLEEVARKLDDYHRSGRTQPDMFQSSLKGKKRRVDGAGDVVDAAQAPAAIREWLSGAEIDWKAMYKRLPRRIGLPTYPFAEERYWIDYENVGLPDQTAVPTVLHPMLDCNVSTLQTQRFLKTLSGGEHYVRDHRVQGMTMLPAAAFMAMAWAAGNRSADRQETARLNSLIWHRPLIVRGEPAQAEIRLSESPSGVSFEIVSGGVNGSWGDIVHATGRIEFGETFAKTSRPAIDVAAIRTRYGSGMKGADFYAKLRQAGMDYGSSFQVVQSLYRSDTEVLSELLAPPEALSWGGSGRTIHPALLDGALQTAGAATLSMTGTEAAYLPFGVDSLEVHHPDAVVRYAYAKALPSADSGHREKRYDIALLDAEGCEAAILRGLTLRRTGEAASEPENGQASEQAVEEWLRQLQSGELSTDLVEQLVGGWIDG